MSTEPTAPVRRITVPQIRSRKGGAPIVSLTSYHAHTAAIVDRHAEIILVGDSLGMVLHGEENTLDVSMEDMIRHTRAVRRGTKRALVVADMPFGSYEESPNMAFRNAAQVMKETGCGAVKLEGGARMGETIRFLTERGIPVMAHIGLTPQSSHVMGGFRRQGSEKNARNKLIAEAIALEEAGAFSIVLECIPDDLAEEITRQVRVPTIGIGSGPHCDGQVLVSYDMLGITEKTPPFVKKYAQLGKAMTEAAQAFAKDVRARAKK